MPRDSRRNINTSSSLLTLFVAIISIVLLFSFPNNSQANNNLLEIENIEETSLENSSEKSETSVDKKEDDQSNIDFLDRAIAIAIILFILSLIAERLINWIKLKFYHKGNRVPSYFF